MKKLFSAMLIFVLALSISGCAQKTASEQLKDDMNKAAKNMNKDLKNF